MTATILNSDKFAFLFRTGADDLSPFVDTLKDYYGYMPANIIESTGCANLINDFKALATTIDGYTPVGGVPAGETATNTLFFIISGDADANGLTDGVDSVSWSQLRDIVSGQFPGSGMPPLPVTINYDNGCEVNLLLITPWCKNFRTEWLNNIPVSDGTLLIPETEADDSLTAVKKAAFTSSWNNLMRLGNPAILNAEKLVSVDAIASEIHPVNLNDFFIAQREAADIGDPFFPGRYDLLIRDGDHPGVGSSWWNSPDIWITNSCYPDDGTNIGNNRYEVGAPNKVHVKVYNNGTHPLKPHHIGITVFPYPFAPGDTNLTPVNLTENDILLAGGSTIEYSWDYNFPALVDHRCVRALLHYDTIPGSIDQPAIWDPHVRFQEAQKNITPAPIACAGGGGGEAPGGGEMPPPVPPGDEGGTPPDPDGAGEKSVDHIRNFREMELLIENPFRDKREFRVIIPKEIMKYEKIFNINIFSFNPKRPSVIYPLKLRTKNHSVIRFTLLPGQQLNLMLHVGLRKDIREFKEVELPFELVVQKKKTNFFFRVPVFRQFKKYASIAGVTFELKSESVNLAFEVADTKGNPVKEAIVYLATLNNRQAAKLLTDKEGKCHFKAINPGAYRVKAYKDLLWYGPEIINAYPRKEKQPPHKLVLKNRR